MKKGGKVSEETKIKIGLAHRGRVFSDEHKNKLSESHKGLKISKETREKISLKMKTSSKRGKENPNWNGGITPINSKIRRSIEYNLWRNSVFARDNWTCQKTGIKGEKLVAHHIKPFAQFPELRFAIDNGITLSKKSHNEFHKKYGRKDNTKVQLDNFLSILT